MAVVLEVRDLTIEFRTDGVYYPTVSGVSFHLNKGEMLALVGESGCGKSVTCLSLARLIPYPVGRIVKGEILIHRSNGEVFDVLKLSESELRKIRGGEIAYIFQEPGMSLNPVMRIGTQLEESIRLHCPDIVSPHDEAVDLLRQVGIPEPEARVSCYPHELSGGMQQRVMIAMALASRPSILIADEPTTALDVTIQAQILELLDRLRREREMSVILVTHNLGIVAQLADRVAVMYAGQIAELAEVSDLLDDSRHPYASALLSAVPVLNGTTDRLKTIPGAVPSPDHFGKGCRFFERCLHCHQRDEQDQKICRDTAPALLRTDKDSHLCACHFPCSEKEISKK